MTGRAKTGTDPQGSLFSIDSHPQRKHSVNFGSLKALAPTPVFQDYWYFAAERQRIFFQRLQGLPAPWSEDRILQTYKFTNAYRVLDRISQYLISDVIKDGEFEDADLCFRILLFKFFNKIETWELLKREVGEPTLRNFTSERYAKILTAAFARGQTLYSAAYIMPSGSRHSTFERKHEMHLDLLSRMVSDNLAGQIASARSLEHVFQMLKAYPSIGNFLAFQYAIDLNYSRLINFDEMSFVVAGPGAQRGLNKCFSSAGRVTETAIITRVTECQRECFDAMELDFQSLWGRPLQLIDCQNLFCEIDKYTRGLAPTNPSGGKNSRIKQKFKMTGPIKCPTLPAKWELKPSL